jgi:hypothetical protein
MVKEKNPDRDILFDFFMSLVVFFIAYLLVLMLEKPGYNPFSLAVTYLPTQLYDIFFVVLPLLLIFSFLYFWLDKNEDIINLIKKIFTGSFVGISLGVFLWYFLPFVLIAVLSVNGFMSLGDRSPFYVSVIIFAMLFIFRIFWKLDKKDYARLVMSVLISVSIIGYLAVLFSGEIVKSSLSKLSFQHTWLIFAFLDFIFLEVFLTRFKKQSS